MKWVPGRADFERLGNSGLDSGVEGCHVSNRFMHLHKFHKRLLLTLFVLALAAFAVLYLVRSDHCVLYYYGAAPEEVPQGTAIAFLNPLRNRGDEKTAEWAIRYLRTDKCEQVSQELRADPVRICATMRHNRKANLIWLDPESDTNRGRTRRLIYDLPDERARLVLYFASDGPLWVVKTVSVLR
jgi:hypothetical protein